MSLRNGDVVPDGTNKILLPMRPIRQTMPFLTQVPQTDGKKVLPKKPSIVEYSSLSEKDLHSFGFSDTSNGLNESLGDLWANTDDDLAIADTYNGAGMLTVSPHDLEEVPVATGSDSCFKTEDDPILSSAPRSTRIFNEFTDLGHADPVVEDPATADLDGHPSLADALSELDFIAPSDLDPNEELSSFEDGLPADVLDYVLSSSDGTFQGQEEVFIDEPVTVEISETLTLSNDPSPVRRGPGRPRKLRNEMADRAKSGRGRGRPRATMNVTPLPVASGSSHQARYRRMRDLNNISSRKCRAKRKEKFAVLAEELQHEESRNQDLKMKERVLMEQIENFKRWQEAYFRQHP